MTLILLFIFILLSIADAWTTYLGLRRPGTYEASPVGRYLIGDGSSLLRLLALKALLVAIFAYALFGQAHQAWVDVLRWIVIGALTTLSAYAVFNNVRLLRDAP